MAIDIRATVTCSLGTLISGTISDSYLQSAGLVKTNGSVVISGLITPAIGTAVTVTYVKAGVSRTIPRRLRVLSSFADPLRRTTSVELGCLLTYLSDLKIPANFTADDDAATTMTQEDAKIVTRPIRAQAVASECLSALGISAANLSLTNSFSIEKYDLGAGYVAVLNELLVSESKFGYLNASEVLQVVPLYSVGGTGPVIDGTQIIDISKIGAGQLPGEAVTVSYSSLKLKREAPQTDQSPWEKTTNQSRYTVNIPYSVQATGASAVAQHEVIDTTTTETNYITITTSNGDQQRQPQSRVTTLNTYSPAVISNIYADYLANGVSYSSYEVQKITTETFSYDSEGNETRYQKQVQGSVVYLLSGLSVPWVLPDGSFVSIPGGTYGIEAETRLTETAGNKKQTTTYTYGPWHKTIQGQLASAAAKLSITTANEAAGYINNMLAGGLSLIDSRTETQSTDTPKTVPTQAEANNAKLARGGNPANGYRTEAKSTLSLAMGSAAAQRRTEFSLPKAPDDVFSANGNSYSSTPSDAPAKAQLYGLTQNRLLLGNRNGVSLQAAPEVLPSAPFAPFVMRSADASAMFRTNGLNWTFDSKGVVLSCDAMFWGGVGGNGAAWFPMAPGTSLLAEPATTTVVINDSNGNPVGSYEQMAVTSLVAPWNETRILAGSLKARAAVTGYPYLLNEVRGLAASVRVGATASLVRLIEVPAASVEVTPQAPVIAAGKAIAVPAANVTTAGLAPVAVAGKAIVVPAADVIVAGLALEFAGRQKTTVDVPAADVLVAGLSPATAAGKAIAVPAVDVAVAGLIPSRTGTVDPSFSNVSLLLHMNGSNNSTTFTDSSSAGLTLTANGNAKISTTQSKFGGSSGYFSRSNSSYVSGASNSAYGLDTGNYTIEAWIYCAFSNSNDGYFTAWSVYNTSTGVRSELRFANSGFGHRLQFNTGASFGAVFGLTLTKNDFTNTWRHVAVVRQSGTVYVYVDGTQATRSTGGPESGTTVTHDIGSTAVIGVGVGLQSSGTPDTNTFFDGYIDELRITKGVARYTANFTPPSAPFPDS
jgi:hypothetical protein